MSQQQQLERVLDLLISEDSEKAAEVLHQIIVEKARIIYENIVNDEEVDATELDEEDEVGGEPSADFTDEISSDEEEINSDEENGGEADSDLEDEEDAELDAEEDEEDAELDVEDRVEDLESQLASLRAEFDALMGEEMLEPQHADLAADMEDGVLDDQGPDLSGEETVVGEVVARHFESKQGEKLKVAPQAKKLGNKVAEETKFLNKTPDTGQRGTAKLVGTGKNTPLGAEQTQSSFTKIPPRVDYGGDTKNILGSKQTGGEPGKYNGDNAADDTPCDNVDVNPKKSGVRATTDPKWTGGKSSSAGEFNKSPLTKKPA